MLKLSMITPINRLRVKNEPQTMKMTKYKYAYILASLEG